MAVLTWFVALPFTRSEEGEIVAGEARECPTGPAAERAACAMMRAEAVGAVAFSRSGDPALGEFEDAVVIASFGEIPRDLAELMALARPAQQSRPLEEPRAARPGAL